MKRFMKRVLISLSAILMVQTILAAETMKRVAVLEHAMMQDNKEILEKDIELEHIYDAFIKAMKN